MTRKLFDKALADFDEAIRLDPEFAGAYTGHGIAHAKLGDYAAAHADYEHAIQLNPQDHSAQNNLAWLLATCPDDNYRDGSRALVLANRACELTGFSNWYCVGTLAAANAEVGNFEEARTWARETLRLAPQEERAGCKQRLKLYKEGKPYRDVE